MWNLNNYFKYCPINSHDELDKEYSLTNLFNDQVTFSRRNNFNDLFDSRVEFRTPSRTRVRNTYKKLSGSSKLTFKQLYMCKESKHNFESLHTKMNEILDSYLFYCITDDPTNNLMWSHYANSHNGFCIEWDKSYVTPDKVTYKKALANIDILELIESTLDLRSKDELGIQAWDALKVKLNEWEYENEFRLKLGNDSKHLIKQDFKDFALVKSQPEWIKSIIFGYRMPMKTRKYIRDNVNKNMIFKEIVIAPDKCSLNLRTLA